MNTITERGNTIRRACWLAFASAALVVWPVIAHVAWLRHASSLHGLPAFFQGLVVFLVFGALARLIGGAIKKGARWLVSRESLRIMGVTLVLVISTVVLLYSLELWRGKRAWAWVVAEARRQNQPLDLKSLIPAPVPADQNFAKAPLFAPLERAAILERDRSGNLLKPNLGALSNVIQLSQRLEAPRSGIAWFPWLEGHATDLRPWLNASLGLKGTNQWTGETNEVALAAAILQTLTPLQPPIDELRTYAGRPHCQLPFDYEFAYFSEFHGERVLVSFMRVLRLRATAELALNQTEEAFQDVELALRLANYLRQQPTLYYQDARARAFADSLQPLWEGLVSGRWSAAQLEAFQNQLHRFNPLADYAAQARFIALANAGFMETVIPTAAPVTEPSEKFAPEARQGLKWIRRIYPVGWSLQNQAVLCRVWLQQNAASTQAAFSPPALREHDGSMRELLRGSSDPFFPVFMVPRVVMMNEELRQHLPFMQTAAQLAALACALERCRLVQGRYPDTLTALVPAFVPQVPADPMDGTSLRYRRMADRSFALYSVGCNRTDENGQPCPRESRTNGRAESQLDLRHNDWVWSSIVVDTERIR